MMEKLVNSHISSDRKALREQFQSARPFRHIAINSLFEKTFAESLLEHFPGFDKKLAINENGEVGGKAVQEKVSTLGPVGMQCKIREFENSTSWRLTRPIRALKQAMSGKG